MLDEFHTHARARTHTHTHTQMHTDMHINTGTETSFRCQSRSAFGSFVKESLVEYDEDKDAVLNVRRVKTNASLHIRNYPALNPCAVK